jgi:N-acetylmuramoyl-L-alanine amidase
MSNKKNPNKYNNRRNTGVKVKKKKVNNRRINKKKFILLICIIGIFGLGMNKVTLGVSQVVKNIDDVKNKKMEEQKKLEEEKQFNLELEQKDGLDKKYTILIDPGHGGKDPGNLGTPIIEGNTKEKIYEKDLNLQIGKKVASILSRQNDVQVILTRTEDKFISLEDRVIMANNQEQKIDAFISIHMNAESGGNTANGIETYYRAEATPEGKSLKLANSVQQTIGSYIKMKDRGVRQEILQVLRDSKVPAILVECGFITNDKEEQKLLDEQYQNQLSEGIAQGVLTFLDENF